METQKEEPDQRKEDNGKKKLRGKGLNEYARCRQEFLETSPPPFTTQLTWQHYQHKFSIITYEYICIILLINLPCAENTFSINIEHILTVPFFRYVDSGLPELWLTEVFFLFLENSGVSYWLPSPPSQKSPRPLFN